MPFKVKGTPVFDRSFAGAVDYLDRTDGSGKATRRFLSELKIIKGYISTFPFMYAIREDESRAFGTAVRAVRVSNFIAYYIVNEHAEEVVFYVLRHAFSDPDAIDWEALTGI